MPLLAHNVPVIAQPQTPVQQTPSSATTAPPDSPFHISLYEPNYIIPLSYVTAPDETVYAGQTPDNQHVSHVEFKFQVSLKVPVLTDIAGLPVTLYGAYTQTSFWQAYVGSAYFRESDYEPSMFFNYRWREPLPGGWTLESVDAGGMHQSNGRGGTLERSWNRLYVAATATHGPWTVRIEPWFPVPDWTLHQHNPDIAHYLGYGRWVASYHHGHQTVSVLSRNNLTSAFRRGAWQLSWSFPVGQTLRGYLQVFSGYGQSLIEYDHRTNAIGLGISLNDW
ncbi:MAG: phospholipase A [Gammaproteobacteria bacterium]